MQSPKNVTVVFGIDCLACQDELFVNNSRDVEGNDEHALDLSSFSPFSVSVSMDFPCTPHAFFRERLSDHCQGLRRTFSGICTKFDAHSRSDPSRLARQTAPNRRMEIISSSPQLCDILYRLQRYGSTIICRCIAPLQLLYRVQHQSRKYG
jgi:hypothetical protein